MNIFKRIFGASKSKSTNKFEPSYIEDERWGTFTNSSFGFWTIDEIVIPNISDKCTLFLKSNEDDLGISNDALDTINSFSDDPSSLWKFFQEEAFELYQNYTDDFPSEQILSNSSEIVKGTNIEVIKVSSNNTFEVTMRFDWQDPNDDHTITFHIENGVNMGESIDG